MSKTPDPVPAETLEILASKARAASQSRTLIGLSEVWPGPEDEFIGLCQSEAGAGYRDIRLVGESGRRYVYSELHMTHSYAEAAALACDKDVCRIIAETVRMESRTYPRPTPIAAFEAPPFHMSSDTVSKAVEDIAGTEKYSDIRLLRASDGSMFLFSSLHMNPGHARSLAEWTAVGELENP